MQGVITCCNEVTYISMGNIQTAYLHHNLSWFHTRAIRLIALRLCSPHTTCFQTWMEMRRLLHLHCPVVCTWLKEAQWLALRMWVMLLNTDFPIRSIPKESASLFWSHSVSPCRAFLIFLLSVPRSLLGTCNSLHWEITLPPLHFWCLFFFLLERQKGVSSIATSLTCISSTEETILPHGWKHRITES